ncbi:MAG: CheR family methyltransferase [Myxococcaceae bacterium]
MSTAPPRSSNALQGVIDGLVQRTRFRPDAIQEERVRRALATTPGDLLDAVLVGETYFFRHPEHFAFVTEWANERTRQGATRLRAWSAGCSSGEEAYSLAGCLLGVMGFTQVEVLGTDISEKALDKARQGIYGNWSVRESGPLLHSVFVRRADGQAQVQPRLQAVTRFVQHNLLDATPPEKEPFDLIFCRNVLVYFDDAAVFQIAQQLSEHLAPGGVVLFGSMEVTQPPAGLERLVPGPLNVFRRPAGTHPPAPQVASVVPTPRPRLAQPKFQTQGLTDQRWIPLHTQAMAHIERGEYDAAHATLTELGTRAPEYVPGILERALNCQRRGDALRATQLMQELLDKTQGLDVSAPVAGPEQLTVAYYRASASAFLAARTNGGGKR